MVGESILQWRVKLQGSVFYQSYELFFGYAVVTFSIILACVLFRAMDWKRSLFFLPLFIVPWSLVSSSAFSIVAYIYIADACVSCPYDGVWTVSTLLLFQRFCSYALFSWSILARITVPPICTCLLVSTSFVLWWVRKYCMRIMALTYRSLRVTLFWLECTFPMLSLACSWFSFCHD